MLQCLLYYLCKACFKRLIRCELCLHKQNHLAADNHMVCLKISVASVLLIQAYKWPVLHRPFSSVEVFPHQFGLNRWSVFNLVFVLKSYILIDFLMFCFCKCLGYDYWVNCLYWGSWRKSIFLCYFLSHKHGVVHQALCNEQPTRTFVHPLCCKLCSWFIEFFTVSKC